MAGEDFMRDAKEAMPAPKTTYVQVEFITKRIAPWIPGYRVARDDQGITIRSESGDHRTFFPFSSIFSITYQRRDA